MTEEHIQRNRAFLADLRANPLKAAGSMRNPNGGRCCLCVAMDTAVRLGMPILKQELEDATQVPPECVATFYGWPNANPLIGEGLVNGSAARLNDEGKGEKYSHTQIADLFEETFPELKTPKA
jgi:hypothetical protein